MDEANDAPKGYSWNMRIFALFMSYSVMFLGFTIGTELFII